MNNAKDILINETLTCCIVAGDKLYKSTKRGVAPLVQWYDEGCDMKDASCADKVVGKAAAYLYVLLGVKEVFAGIISEKAKEVFLRFGISFAYSECVPAIINRTGDGFCPMETAVSAIDDPEDALYAVKEKMKELAK